MAESQAVGLGATTGPEAAAGADDDTLYCYRHPKTETRLRCSQCERPICSKCAILTPVGYRCPDDGRAKNDPFTTFQPSQLAVALLVALLGGAILGFISNQIGFFSIIISFFGGTLIVEAENRVVGLKRGPVMVGIVLGGILLGTALGFGYEWFIYWAPLSQSEAADAFGPLLIQQQLTYALINAVAACVGAYTRLR